MIYTETGHVVTNQPIIGIRNVARFENLDSVSPVQGSFPGMEVTTPVTYGGWVPQSSPATLSYTGLSGGLDFMGIAAHTLGSEGASVQLTIGTDVIGTISPVSDEPIMWMFNARDEATAQVEVTFSGDSPLICVVYIGRRITMPHNIYGGVAPPQLNPITARRPQLSESGKILGRRAIRKGVEANFTFEHLDPAWVRSTFQEFVDLEAETPFFFAWRPLSYPEEVSYLQTSQDVSVVNSGVAGLMTATIDAEGVG